MFNNRAYINELKSKIEFLEKDIESKENIVVNVLDANKELSQHTDFLQNRIALMKIVNKDLLKDIEEKEDRVINLLDSIEDLQLDKNCLLERIKKYEQLLEQKELIICELNTKLCRSEGKLNDLDNYIKMTTGMSLLDREEKE